MALGEFCSRVVDEACAYKFRCGYFSDAGLDACRRTERQEFANACTRADAGLLAYSPENALACLQRMTTSKCWLGPPCGVIQGSLMPENVFTDLPNPRCGLVACASGSFCDRDCSAPACLPFAGIGSPCDLTGVDTRRCDDAVAFCEDQYDGGAFCVARRAIGQPCLANDCVAGSLCFRDPMMPATATCIAPLPNGAACPSPAYSSYCASGWCTTAGQCASRDAGMAPCRAPSDCASGIQGVCRGLVLAPDGGVLVQGVCGGPSALGAACSMDWGRGSCDTLAGHACLDGVCKRLTAGSLDAGDECIRPPFGVQAPYYGFAACPRGFSCQEDPTAFRIWGRCRPALGIGARCTTQFHSCADGLSCEVIADGGSVCQVLNAAGAPCPCLQDFRCVTGADGGRACAPLAGVDAGCSYTTECLPSLRCLAGSCLPPLPAGATCTYDDDCADSLCRNRRCAAVCVAP